MPELLCASFATVLLALPLSTKDEVILLHGRVLALSLGPATSFADGDVEEVLPYRYTSPPWYVRQPPHLDKRSPAAALACLH